MRLPVASVEVQGYAYAAYETAVHLAGTIARESCDWAKRAGELKQKFNERFWMEGTDFFALALDGRKEPVKEIGSNAGHLLFTGILDKDRQSKVTDRLLAGDMLTDYGIRTHSSLSRLSALSASA